MARKQDGLENTGNKKVKKAKKIRRRIFLVCAELMILGGVLAWFWADSKMDKITTDNTFVAKEVKNVELTKETQDILGGYTTFALFGLDNRDGSTYNSGNSDVIMVARIDNKDRKSVV